MPHVPEGAQDRARFKVLARSHMREAPSLAPWGVERDPVVNGLYDRRVYVDRWAEFYREMR